MLTFSTPAGAAASGARTKTQPGPDRTGGALRRWFAALAEVRQRKASILVLRHLDRLIPYATGAEHADLVARAEALRRSLR